MWALRDQGTERDRAAVRFTRNPASLLRALEQLDADATEIGHVTRATAPLWIEFPAKVLAGSSTSPLASSWLRVGSGRRISGMPRGRVGSEGAGGYSG